MPGKTEQAAAPQDVAVKAAVKPPLPAAPPGEAAMKKRSSETEMGMKKSSSETFLGGYIAVDDALPITGKRAARASFTSQADTEAACTMSDDLAAMHLNKKLVFHATYRVTYEDDDTPPGAVKVVTGQRANGELDDLEDFKEGFTRFRDGLYLTHRDFFGTLANEQHPETLVIACCDSRVDPTVLMGAGPGDLFVFRNIANLVPAYERNGSFVSVSAALEYGVLHLKVKHIVVLGHKNCGGIKALMTRKKGENDRNSFIDGWVEIGAPAAERTKLMAGHLPFDQQCNTCERESINVSLANLLTFPWIKEAVGRRELKVHGWYYDLEAATMETWQLQYHVAKYEVV